MNNRCHVSVASFLACCLCGAVSATGGGIFHDTFEDGNATDGSPVAWAPHPNPNYRGQYRVEHGDFVISGGRAPVALVEGLTVSDVSIRALVRMSGDRGETSLLARGSVSPSETAYQAGIHTDGRVYIGWNDPEFNYLGEVATDLRVLLEDVFLQFDVIGTSLSLYAWRANEAPPTTPRLTALDSRFASGAVGLLHFPQSGNVSSQFKFVQVATTHIPEPSGFLMALFGMLFVRIRRW